MIVTLSSTFLSSLSSPCFSFPTKLRDCELRSIALSLKDILQRIKTNGWRGGAEGKGGKNKRTRRSGAETEIRARIAPSLAAKKLMRGYARLDLDRPFIRRQSILVLSAVDSDVKRVAPHPRQMAPSLTCVPRASGVRGSTGDTIHVSSGERERVHLPHTSIHRRSVRRMCAHMLASPSVFLQSCTVTHDRTIEAYLKR
jgi:hypothetical protein